MSTTTEGWVQRNIAYMQEPVYSARGPEVSQNTIKIGARKLFVAVQTEMNIFLGQFPRI